MFNLDGKVAFMAGGAGYLGLPVCRGMLEHGAEVIIGDYNKKNLTSAVDELTGDFPGKSVFGINFNIADEASISSAVFETVERFGSLDIMVNATFFSVGKPVEELRTEEFDRANRVNITGTFLLARAAADVMTNGGSIILFSSMYGLISPNQADYPTGINKNPVEYGAGKAAVNQLTRYLAAEYGKRNIRVNSIAPGPFPGRSVQEKSRTFMENLAAKTMLGRIGRREEIAGTVVYLASEASAYMTGQILSVDGGITSW